MNFSKHFSLLALTLILSSTSIPLLASHHHHHHDYDRDEDDTEIIEVKDGRLNDGQKVWNAAKGVFWGWICLNFTWPAAACSTLGVVYLGALTAATNEPAAVGMTLGCALLAIPSDIAAWYTTKWCIQAFQKALREEKERRFKLKKKHDYYGDEDLE